MSFIFLDYSLLYMFMYIIDLFCLAFPVVVVGLWCICLAITVNKIEVWWQYLPPT